MSLIALCAEPNSNQWLYDTDRFHYLFIFGSFPYKSEFCIEKSKKKKKEEEEI
jgi:hypothetical protein